MRKLLLSIMCITIAVVANAQNFNRSIIMKTKLMTVLLVMTALGLKAQDYIPLVAEGKQWNVLYTYAPWPPINRVTNAYKVEGDTVVGGTTYRKLLTTRSEQYDNWSLWGLLRETEERQVFCRKYRWDHTFASETLLYNFLMQPGDSICYGSSTCLLLLRKSDTILDDETVRKRYDFQYKEGGYLTDVYETWIEGIGSELGLLHSGSMFLVGGSYDLLCYYENEDLIWQHPDFNSCYIGTDGVEENKAEAWISIHPNPTTGMIVVSGKNLNQAEVLNLLGQRMATAQGKGETLQIDIANLPTDVYFVNITDEEGRTYVRKVVKE